MLSKENIEKKIKSVFWDYNVDPGELYQIVLEKKHGEGFLNKEYVFKRILERLSWYEIIEIFGLDFLKRNLTAKIIFEIRNTTLKSRYEFIRKILQGETLSFTGWSIENRKRLKSSVLSHRWNRT